MMKKEMKIKETTEKRMKINEATDGRNNHRKVVHRDKQQILPPIKAVTRPKPALAAYGNPFDKKVKKKETSKSVPPPLRRSKDKPLKEGNTAAGREGRTFHPNASKRLASRSVPPPKTKEKRQSEREENQRRSRSQPPTRIRRRAPTAAEMARTPAKVTTTTTKTAWKKPPPPPPPPPRSRLETSFRPRRAPVVDKSVESGVVVATESSSASELQSPPRDKLSVKEIQKRKVKKIVDYVYTMDCAYGSIASKFARVSLDDDDDDGDSFDVRRGGLSSRKTMRPRERAPIRGLTGILSGRTSALSDYGVIPKTPKLMYSSLISLRR